MIFKIGDKVVTEKGEVVEVVLDESNPFPNAWYPIQCSNGLTYTAKGIHMKGYTERYIRKLTPLEVALL